MRSGVPIGALSLFGGGSIAKTREQLTLLAADRSDRESLPARTLAYRLAATGSLYS